MTPPASQAERDAATQAAMGKPAEAKADSEAKAPEKVKSKADTRYGKHE